MASSVRRNPPINGSKVKSSQGNNTKNNACWNSKMGRHTAGYSRELYLGGNYGIGPTGKQSLRDAVQGRQGFKLVDR